ncbi:unnamed protein product [Fraxinus pennsylvanica]|uniref:L-gulonolactone oxidase n=1 Tax=Fraxinus pennsylvanica TaxID=56036 RepID=A0AAD2DZP0_9LAMI|nr:unnamed protein product [Fraxinus pennsylvanica]
MVNCSPPEDPVKCTVNNSNCTITNTYGAFPDRSICRAAKVVYPTTEEELILAVANATMAKTKMKVATRTSHSIPKLVCPEGINGLLISTKCLNRTLVVNVSSMTMTVESGMTLRQLINEAAKAKLALPYAPYWWGLTIGGMMGTGAHGSSLWGLGSQVHDYVIRLRIVTPATAEEGYAKVRTLEIGSPELDAAKVSLGVLGVISQVTLKLQPLFKRSITYVRKNDSDLGEQAVSFGRQHEYADFIWYPSQKRVAYRIDDRVPSNTSGNGLLDFPGLFFHQTTFSISSSKVKNFIEDVQQLVAIEPKSMCGLDLYNGILMRYVTTSTAFLGKQEDALDFDITYYRSKDPMSPRLYEDILEEIEQIAIFKYGALPHWGKNRNVAFDGVIKKFKNASEFLKVKNKYDPQGLFSNSWTDQILGLKGKVTIEKEGCALEGLCICSQDIHCAPKKNYFCRPGKVYRDAKVCTKVVTNKKSTAQVSS